MGSPGIIWPDYTRLWEKVGRAEAIKTARLTNKVARLTKVGSYFASTSTRSRN
jgi:hypothetical protein